MLTAITIRDTMLSTSSKKSTTTKSNQVSASSKQTESSVDEDLRPSFEEIRRHGTGVVVSAMHNYSSGHRHQDPYYPGGHTGRRVSALFDEMIRVEDNLSAADADADAKAKATSKTRPRPK